MKFSFPPKKESIKERVTLGIDIGSSAIKFVKLKIKEDLAELCSFGIEPFSEAEIVPKIKHIIQGQEQKKISISVSGSPVIMREIDFMRMNREELKHALRFEAQKHIPFSVEEVYLDSFILKNDLPDNKMLVLIVAAKKDFLNQKIKPLQEAGAEIITVDLDSLALANAFNFNYQLPEDAKNKTVALLNIGACLTNLVILEDSFPRLNRDINIAGNNFTQRLSDLFGIEFKDAEILKITPEKDKLSQIQQAQEGIIAGLAAEIRTSFDYYESQGASTAGKIYLSGGGAFSLGVKEVLNSMLDIEVECWNPFSKINIANEGINSETAKKNAGQLAVATGLALR